MLAMFAAHCASAAENEKAASIVLVHGAFVDGSGWKAVYDLLSQKGYEVLVTQHATATLEGDVATVKSVIDARNSRGARRPLIWRHDHQRAGPPQGEEPGIRRRVRARDR